MPDRYWVGGTASWDATAGTKWAATSGGAGGQSVPTSNDNVFFDAASGAVTVTTSGVNVSCNNLNFTGFSGTIAGTSIFSINGSVTAVAGMSWTSTGTLQFIGSGTQTLTSAGKTLGAITLNAASTTLSLQDALTSSGAITVTTGTFTTNNFNITATNLSSSNSNTRTINLGSSTVTLTGFAGASFSTSTGLSLNAGTSTFLLTAAGSSITSGSIAGPSLTFNNVTFSSNSVSAVHAIGGFATFNNITVTGPSGVGFIAVNFSGPQTINGTLSTTGTAGNRRVWFRSTNYGIAHTLRINSAPSLTDADFRDIYVIGTAAPISGTRIGNLRGCRGITFSTPKTVYWNLVAGGNWSANAWAATSGGAVSTDNFPLAQDTAVIENIGLTTTATVTLDSAITYIGTLDMSTRTSAMTFNASVSPTFYGNVIFGSGTTYNTNLGTATFSGRNTQTITTAGKTWGDINVDSYGGTVQLADALNIGSRSLTITNGTFSTQNFNVTASQLSSSNSNVRTINLGSSTVTLSGNPIAFSVNTNLTFNAGTSTIISTASSGSIVTGSGVTFYDVSINSVVGGTPSLNGVNTFRNLTVGAPGTAGIISLFIQANQTITGTLTCAGATAVRRVFLCSDAVGTPRILTANSLSAQDCDFRDITIAGAAAGSSPTRAGDCGGNTGITFPAPKTVYWNLAGTQNWSATGWATSSGGSPDINNFPLAQDTAVFDNTGAAGTVALNAAWNIGTFNASARTSAMTFNLTDCQVYGNWSHGSGLTFPGFNAGVNFFRNGGTQTITSNGVSFGNNRLRPGTVNGGRVLLADAFTSSGQIQHGGGEFDANGFNVTAGGYESTNTVNVRVLRMGGGLWTLTSTGSVWSINASTTFILFKSTSNILFSDTSTSARSFSGSGLSYNKVTIGGATGTSIFTLNDGNQFTELASTKTVAHTISITTAQTFGAWTVTGTAGNVVTITGTAALTIAGAAVSGVDYLALGTTTVSATSPGEFYAGANSTATGATAPLYLTAKPADSTRFWVGGTGNWSDTARWSTSSGGAGGASIPRSHDDVVFDSASNATAYTATVNAVTGGIRCKALTIAGPASGNLTLAGSTAIDGIHGDVTLPATGLTRTYTGAITLSGSATGRTITTNGVVLGSTININGVGCEWTLGGAINSNLFQTINGSFTTNNYNLTTQGFQSTSNHSRTINLGSSTLSISGFVQPLILGTSENARAALTFNAGTSQILIGANDFTFSGNNQTFNNVSFTSGSIGTATINGVNVFNNLSVTGRTSAGINNIVFTANQTINGTLTLSAGTNATMRTFVRSNTIDTTRTLTCAAVASLTDIDFRDITIAGAAAPVSGTRLGDCKGNSGITFPAAKTVFWRGGIGDWGANNWSATNGGSIDATQFPLAQDTATIPSGFPASGNTITINAAYNIGTIDMSARTSNTMTLATSTNAPTIYGNWINGTGTTLTGTGVLSFSGRGSQTITSAGRTFTQPLSIATPGGSVTLQDALTATSTSNFNWTHGTFDANNFNVTIGGFIQLTSSTPKTVAVGSGTWVFTNSSGSPWNAAATNFTVTGTGTISLTGASAKSFTGGGVSYSGITLNQGGAGTLTINGSNTFANISNSYKATGATTIDLGNTTQRVGTFTASGEVGRVLTLQGFSASNPATLVFTGSGAATQPTTDYLAVTSVRAYSLVDTWYAGANSTNNGSLGWYFEATPGGAITVFIVESATANSTESSLGTFNPTVSELANGSDSIISGLVYLGTLNESATVADAISAVRAFFAEVAEATTAADIVDAAKTLATAIISESAQGQETVVAQTILNSLFSDSTTLSDSVAGGLFFNGSVSEAAAAAESLLASLSVVTNVSESSAVQELAAVVASTFGATTTETTSLLDTIQTAATFPTALSESAQGSEAKAGLFTAATAVSESVTSSESSLSVAAFGGQIVESVAGLDGTMVAASTFAATASEIVQALDLLDAPGSIYNSSFASAVAIADVNQGLNTISLSVIENASSTDEYAAKFTAASYIIEQSVAQFGPISVTTTRFDYEAVKDLYSRKRTVYVSRSSLPSDRVVVVPAMNRTVYIPRSTVPEERTASVSSSSRVAYADKEAASSAERTIIVN